MRPDFTAAFVTRVLGAALLALGVATDARAELDLVGTWHVLVHYTDSDAANPETQRWDDRLWVFERRGSRLVWTEYPIVVFSDRSGRFERSNHGQQRVLHAWEPNSAQRAQIDAGLEFNSRGSKSKSLRRKRDGSWHSMGAPQQLSASVVGYHETWTISGDAVPSFTRDDVLGSQRAEPMSGRTRYRGVELAAGGNVIRGEFARDESRRGSFRMLRAGAVASVGTKRTQRERTRDGFNLDDFDSASDSE